MKRLLLLVLLAWAGASLAPMVLPALLRAQISSPAFDPNCYQPQIGVDIDTIMGSYNGQGLGDGLINIGPSPNDTGGPGRLMMYGLPETLGDSSAGLLNVGPSFNYRNLNITTMLGFKVKNPVFGHFRSPKYNDMLITVSNGQVPLPVIYWQADDGTYDSSNYTTLLPEKGAPNWEMNLLGPPYHAHLTSDTVEDIVMMYRTPLFDSVNVCIFTGGSKLFQPGKTIAPDSIVLFDTSSSFGGFRTFQGDFRGTGREDCICEGRDTDFGPANWILFFYRNDPPFSLAAFVQALKRDTIFSTKSVPWLNPFYFDLGHAVIQIRNDAPTSLLLLLDSAVGTPAGNEQAKIFVGGAQFGSKRLTLEDALTIHAPAALDGGNFRMSGWGLSLADCGDMTGSGDHVLGVEGNFGEDESFYTFYVLGNSFDEKVDMYVQLNDFGGVSSMDSATLDGDRLEDVVIGTPSLPDLVENGLQARGSLLFIHGTNKIPVKNQGIATRGVSSDTISVNQMMDGRMLDIRLPDDNVSELRFVLRDILGRTVFEQEASARLEIQLTLPELPRGTYLLEVQTNEKVYDVKLAL